MWAQNSFSLVSRWLMTSTSAAAARRHVRVVENRKQLRGPPSLNVYLFTDNPTCRLQHRLVLASSRTKIAIPMRRNFNSDDCCSEMSRMTEKFNRAFPVTVLQFAVCRAHSAHRLDPTVCAFRQLSALAMSQLGKRTFPYFPDTRTPDTKCFLLRYQAYSEFTVGIECKAAESTATKVQSVAH